MEQIFTILLSCFCTIAIAFAFMTFSVAVIFLIGSHIKDIKWLELHAGKHLWFKLKRK
jgi:hypothetical protein|nr:MAG TPA: hypothetical protein [Caudoviricetes sp.]